MVFGRLADLARPSLSDSESDNLKLLTSNQIIWDKDIGLTP